MAAFVHLTIPKVCRTQRLPAAHQKGVRLHLACSTSREDRASSLSLRLRVLCVRKESSHATAAQFAKDEQRLSLLSVCVRAAKCLTPRCGRNPRIHKSQRRKRRPFPPSFSSFSSVQNFRARPSPQARSIATWARRPVRCSALGGVIWYQLKQRARSAAAPATSGRGLSVRGSIAS